jgi:hypothetical protein
LFLFWVNADFWQDTANLHELWIDSYKLKESCAEMWIDGEKCLGGSQEMIRSWNALTPTRQEKELSKKILSALPLEIPYKMFEGLEVFGVATKNIPAQDIRLWLQTCRYFGYDAYVLGREEEWGGWPFRTRRYLQAVRESSADIVVLADVTDVFFTASASEMRDRFLITSKRTGKKALVGAEKYPHYAQGSFSVQQVESYFQNGNEEAENPYRFPNAGFVIGERRVIQNLLELNKDAPDDQAGYFDLFYQDHLPQVGLDTRAEIVGNVPDYFWYGENTHREWIFDGHRHRYYHSSTGTTPCAFHFPFQNRTTMHAFARKIFKNHPFINVEDLPNIKDDRTEIFTALAVAFLLLYVLLTSLMHSLDNVLIARALSLLIFGVLLAIFLYLWS